jgi:signal transduction histidine kinase
MQYDQMKSDFLATVAHEINTPLAVIAASGGDTVDLLNESPLNIDEIKENQLVIEKKVKLIDNIILDLMDAVAIETGKLTLNRQLVNLSEFLKNTCNAHHKQLDLNNNRIAYAFQTALPQIWLDPLRIEQVIVNLLSNAFRHTTNGIITVKLKQADGGGQIVSVTDNGEGMDMEMARAVLKQYVSTKKDYWRHGIGLYICRRIVSAHGGDIWIESEKERGTTVYFTLKGELTDDDDE